MEHVAHVYGIAHPLTQYPHPNCLIKLDLQMVLGMPLETVLPDHGILFLVMQKVRCKFRAVERYLILYLVPDAQYKIHISVSK